VIYTLAGSMLMLLGVLKLYPVLRPVRALQLRHDHLMAVKSAQARRGGFLALFAGFAVKCDVAGAHVAARCAHRGAHGGLGDLASILLRWALTIPAFSLPLLPDTAKDRGRFHRRRAVDHRHRLRRAGVLMQTDGRNSWPTPRLTTWASARWGHLLR